MNPRFHHAEVRTRKPHPCHWCPDTIPAYVIADSWVCPDSLGLLKRCWAHAYCDSEAMNEIAESMGADDDAVCEPDRECIPRMLSFMRTEADLEEFVLRGLDPEERQRLTDLWRRCNNQEQHD